MAHRAPKAGAPTMREIARLANVSTTTASDALAGVGRVAPKTRARIEQIAAELGYVPNSAARRLRRPGVGTLGLYLHPHATELDYFKTLVMAAFTHGSARGFDITLLGPRDVSEQGLVGRVDGLVISDPLPASDPHMRALFGSGVPIVTIERPDPELPAPVGVICSDHTGAVTEMLDAMARSGVRRPACLTVGDDFASSWASEILAAYVSWCTRHDVRPAVERTPTDASMDEVDAAIRRLFAAVPDLDGLFCSRDGLVTRASGLVREFGREVGRDFALAAGDDPAMLQYFVPPIAAINLDPAGYVRQAIDLLLGVIRGEIPVGTQWTHEISYRDRASAHLSESTS